VARQQRELRYLDVGERLDEMRSSAFVQNPEREKIQSTVGERALGEDLMKV
jgi:hypothetical protein